MPLFFTKTLRGLKPADEASAQALAKIKLGGSVQLDLKRPRNIKFHRKYWGLVNLVWENIDHDRYPSQEDLHDAIKICVGHRTRIELPSGDVGYRAKSIAFHKMNEDEFSMFYDRVCDLISKHFLSGLDAGDLKAEVGHMIGVPIFEEQED